MDCQEFVVNGVALRFALPKLQLVSLRVGEEPWLDQGPKGASLWQLLAVDREGWRATLDANSAQQATAEVAGDVLCLTWTEITGTVSGLAAPAGPFTVQVRIAPLARRGLTGWRLTVENRATAWTLWHVVFASLGGLLPSAEPERDQLIFPEGWGTVRTGWDHLPKLQRRYPCGWDCPMQLLALARPRQVFYLATHDPRLTCKQFEFSPGEAADNGCKPVISRCLADARAAGERKF